MSGRRVWLLAALVLPLAGCGGGSTVARVGDRTVTQQQVQRLLDHAREEAAAEGDSFPQPRSGEYRALRQQAVAILVARAQILVAAERVGVRVSDDDVAKQVQLPHKELPEVLWEQARASLGVPEIHEKGEAAKLLADQVRVQLTLQRLERKLGATRLQAWLARARQIPVSYP
jgi:hypothetical protein